MTIEESESLVMIMDRMHTFFDDEGLPVSSQNPTGNIAIDFCFNFVYPITLIYNSGSTVTVNSIEELISIVISSSENLYISGIEFPFQVEYFNQTTQAIEVLTIHNEEEFQTLLDSCNFDCICTEIYDPVCVSIGLPDGSSTIIEYPNQCYAECDGFVFEDLLDCSNCNCPLVYDPVCVYDPVLGIIEYTNACYAECDGYTQNDFIDCSGCSIYALDVFPGDCYGNGTYNLFIDFEYIQTTNYPYFDIYLRNNEYLGSIPLNDLPVVILNFPLSGAQYDYIKICIDGGTDCCIETEWIPPACNSPINPNTGTTPQSQIIYKKVKL